MSFQRLVTQTAKAANPLAFKNSQKFCFSSKLSQPKLVEKLIVRGMFSKICTIKIKRTKDWLEKIQGPSNPLNHVSIWKPLILRKCLLNHNKHHLQHKINDHTFIRCMISIRNQNKIRITVLGQDLAWLHLSSKKKRERAWKTKPLLYYSVVACGRATTSPPLISKIPNIDLWASFILSLRMMALVSGQKKS